MSNTVFSVSLDALHLAKIKEIMKRFPSESRNAVIKRCIHYMHDKNAEVLKLEAAQRYRMHISDFLETCNLLEKYHDYNMRDIDRKRIYKNKYNKEMEE